MQHTYLCTHHFICLFGIIARQEYYTMQSNALERFSTIDCLNITKVPRSESYLCAIILPVKWIQSMKIIPLVLTYSIWWITSRETTNIHDLTQYIISEAVSSFFFTTYILIINYLLEIVNFISTASELYILSLQE